MAKIYIVDKILETDHEAKAITEQAENGLKNLDSDLKREYAALRKSYFNRADRRIKNVVETETKFAEETIKDLDAELAREIQHAKDLFAEQAADWVDTIYSYVIRDSEA